MEGSGLVAIADRAQDNMNYVRALLKTNQPEFAALLDRVQRELTCPVCGGNLCLPGADDEAFLETVSLLLEREGVTVTATSARL
jgi:hypothetical protein